MGDERTRLEDPPSLGGLTSRLWFPMRNFGGQ